MPREYQKYTNKEGESKTIAEWSRDTGINASTLTCRLKKGMTIDEALETSTDRAHSAVTDPVTGETHSLKEWSEILGIPYSSLCRRVSAGWPIEKVLHGEKNKTYKKETNYSWKRGHVDLTGKKFGHLTVLRRANTDYEYVANGKKRHEWKWVCQCDCPEKNIIEVIQHNLTNGHCTSCGCMNKNKLIDMTGKEYKSFTVEERVDKSSEEAKDIHHNSALWLCKYNNGRVEIKPGTAIRVYGDTITGRERNSAGGLSDTDIYKSYQNMISRCENPNDSEYKNYGERGIHVCDEWKSEKGGRMKEGFLKFYNWSMEHGYEEGLTIDRIDNNKGYEPSNCRWATMKDQNNNRRNNHRITYNNETKTASEWSEVTGIPASTIAKRHREGWSAEKTIETPVRKAKLVTNSLGESHTLDEWAAITGLSRDVIYSRIYNLGWNVDIALMTKATNPEIYNHIPYGFNPIYYNPENPGYIPVYTDIFGRNYTPEEWFSHQAVYFL